MTAVIGLRDNVWTIAALHWAEAMPNATAYKLAREGELATPDAIPNTNDTSPLAAAMRTAFASKPSFVDARSTRADAFNFGSAPGERLKGGDAIRKIFGRISATIHLHDAVKVGLIGDAGGWGIANVDFTDAGKDGTEVTQTFRVLAAWIKEDAAWRIVLTQWSNPR
jgi:ketosteroid isomerase-like protein